MSSYLFSAESHCLDSLRKGDWISTSMHAAPEYNYWRIHYKVLPDLVIGSETIGWHYEVIMNIDAIEGETPEEASERFVKWRKKVNDRLLPIVERNFEVMSCEFMEVKSNESS